MIDHGTQPRPKVNIPLAAAGALVLACTYVFQHFPYATYLGVHESTSPNLTFIVNRIVRMVLNDSACLLLIYALFRERKYLRVAFLVFCMELLIILPVYLTVKLYLEGPSEISSPLLSQVHRLIVNPMLMIILIFGFYYQRWTHQK
jgi:exosortase F-associated protein